MRREILNLKRGRFISGCCPGHDAYPNDVYSSRRSKKARSRDIKREHRTVRTISRQKLVKELKKED